MIDFVVVVALVVELCVFDVFVVSWFCLVIAMFDMFFMFVLFVLLANTWNYKTRAVCVYVLV